MKNIKYSLFLVVFLSFFVLACESENFDFPEKPQQINILDLYRGFTSPDRAASISVINYQANFTPDTWAEQTLATVTCVPEKLICDYDEVMLGGHTFAFGAGSDRYDGPEYKSLFGKDIALTFGKDGEVSTRGPEAVNLYIPMVLDVTIGEIPNLQNGYTITWNADAQNTDGVYIVLEYTPFENPRLRPDYPDKIYNYVKVDDIGSYVFSKNDFPDVPGTSLTTLRIIRGAFELPVIEGELLRVYAVTHVGGYARVQFPE